MAVTNPTLWKVLTVDEVNAARCAGTGPDWAAEQAERAAIFEKIKPAGNWKMPIDAVIDAADFDDCNEACIWFTGGVLVPAAPAETGPMRVTSGGYYENIGA